jgi:hypothetical protein
MTITAATSSIAPDAYLQSGSSPPTTQSPADLVTAQTDIGTAWQSYKKNTLEFGRVCYGWAQHFEKSKGGRGTKGEGQLSEILRVLSIPQYVVDYAISVYKASIGDGIPCDHCTETFPSKTQLKRHQHKKHPATFAAPQYPVSDYSDHPQEQAIIGARSRGYGLKRRRDEAEQLGVDAQIAHDGTNWAVTHGGQTVTLPTEAKVSEFIKAQAPAHMIVCPTCGTEFNIMASEQVSRVAETIQ